MIGGPGAAKATTTRGVRGGEWIPGAQYHPKDNPSGGNASPASPFPPSKMSEFQLSPLTTCDQYRDLETTSLMPDDADRVFVHFIFCTNRTQACHHDIKGRRYNLISSKKDIWSPTTLRLSTLNSKVIQRNVTMWFTHNIEYRVCPKNTPPPPPPAKVR